MGKDVKGMNERTPGVLEREAAFVHLVLLHLASAEMMNSPSRVDLPRDVRNDGEIYQDLSSLL